MKISFDPAKREKTLRERGVDFLDAVTVFAGPVHTFEDDRFEYPERRYVTAGLLAGRMMIIIWTPTSDGRRVISMRKANAREKSNYQEQLAKD